MAAYAATVTVENVDLAVGHGQLALGTVDVTNYNQTNLEITKLSQLFGGRAPKKVMLASISDNGYFGLWDETNGTIIAYYPSNANTPSGSISAGVIAVTNGTAGNNVTNNSGVLEATDGDDLAVNAQTFTGDADAAAAATEVANDVDVGSFHFTAFG